MARKVIDCFTFFDEVKILNMRLHELDEFVDYFVLVESPVTFSGLDKELFYENNKELFNKFADKIIHVVADSDKVLSRGTSRNRPCYQQRNFIAKGTDQLDLSDEDIILISDVDEIPNGLKLAEFKNNDEELLDRYAFLMRHFYYSFKWERLPTALTPNKGGEDCSWAAARLTPYRFYKENKENITGSIRSGTTTLAGKGWRRKKYGIFDGGWHCAYFGEAKEVKKKYKSWGHFEEYADYIKDFGTLEYFQKRMDDGQFIFPREDGWETSEAEKLTEVDVENDNNLPKYKDLANHELG